MSSLLKLPTACSLPRRITFGSVAFIIMVLFFTLAMQLSRVDSWSFPKKQTENADSMRYSTGEVEAPSKQYDNERGGHASPTVDINRVTNDTLGFSKVFVVGLPERTDKRDAIALTSSLTGFQVEWVDGVRGETVVDKALPFGVDRKELWENNLGSWRGHMNAVRRIVDESLESVLIMEDDMDWDVGLKLQLEQVARGARQLLSTNTSTAIATTASVSSSSSSSSSSSHSTSPYGDEWDILWLGHCGEVFPEMLDENKGKPLDDAGLVYMQRKFMIQNDSTVPPQNRVTGLIDFKQYPEHTRWVHITGAPICTFAYALSQRGARKVLFDLSVDHLVGPFDNSLAALCRRAVSTVGVAKDASTARDRGLDTKCISVTPPLFFHHKAKGRLAGDSDIQAIFDDGVTRQKGFTENIVWSARNNIRNMIMGTPMENQFVEGANG